MTGVAPLPGAANPDKPDLKKAFRTIKHVNVWSPDDVTLRDAKRITKVVNEEIQRRKAFVFKAIEKNDPLYGSKKMQDAINKEMKALTQDKGVWLSLIHI